jgi:hypothetical protein
MRRPKAVACCSQPDTLTQRQSLLRRHATAVNDPVSATRASEAKALPISTAVFAGRGPPRPLVANQNASVATVGVVAVAIGIIAIVRAAIGIAGIGSSGVGCTITVSPPAIAMAEASRTAVADRCRASLDRACNCGSVTTAGTDAKRPWIAARTSAGAQPGSRTAEASMGRTARPHGRWTGKLRKHRSRRQGNRCERHADGQRQECLPGHCSLRSRFASRGPAPARPVRESGSTNGCRALAQRPHALARHRREQGGSGTTPHRAPAGTRASAVCRR